METRCLSVCLSAYAWPSPSYRKISLAGWIARRAAGCARPSSTRVREIGMGDSINILTVLRVWDRCIETVVVVGARFVESYAVSASDFYDLFEHDVSLVFVHSDFGGCCYWLTVANVATGISHIDTLLLGCSANQIKMKNEK